MSTNFLTITEAYNKIGYSLEGGKGFIKKNELIATNKCDTSKLNKYSNNNYVIDDDIIKLEELNLLQILQYSGNNSNATAVTLNMSRAFNPSRGFHIAMKCTPISSGWYRILTIHSLNIKGTPREILLYGSTSDHELALGVITSDVGTYYHLLAGVMKQNLQMDIDITYNPNTKIYITTCNGVSKTSLNVSAVNRNCAYCYVNGEKYYSSGNGIVNYANLTIWN